MTVQQVIDIIESVFPLRRQEGWDNSGLQIGSRETHVAKVLLCTDVTEAVVQEAIEKQCEMIVSHHPLLFHGLKTIQGNTRAERCAIMAIRNDIAVYSSHTAADCYLHGVSGQMAAMLGIEDYAFLVTTGDDSGLGAVGKLKEPLDFKALLTLVKNTFSAPVVRYTEPLADTVQTIAMCGGAGSEFMDNAIAAGADVYITADAKYHEFQAADQRIALLDIGHFESEQHLTHIIECLLRQHLPELLTERATADKSPILIY